MSIAQTDMILTAIEGLGGGVNEINEETESINTSLVLQRPIPQEMLVDRSVSFFKNFSYKYNKNNLVAGVNLYEYNLLNFEQYEPHLVTVLNIDGPVVLSALKFNSRCGGYRSSDNVTTRGTAKSANVFEMSFGDTTRRFVHAPHGTGNSYQMFIDIICDSENPNTEVLPNDELFEEDVFDQNTISYSSPLYFPDGFTIKACGFKWDSSYSADTSYFLEITAKYYLV